MHAQGILQGIVGNGKISKGIINAKSALWFALWGRKWGRSKGTFQDAGTVLFFFSTYNKFYWEEIHLKPAMHMPSSAIMC